MDLNIVSLVSQAIVSGATAVVGDLAGQALKDAYLGVKKLIVDRYGESVMEEVERAPTNEEASSKLENALASETRAIEEELIVGAQHLLSVIEEQGASALPSGISIADIQGMNIRIRDLVSEGSINISNIKGNENVDIGGFVVGAKPPSSPPAALHADLNHLSAGENLYVNIHMGAGERRRLPITQRLFEPLQLQLEACRIRNVKYRTAHLMAALLQLEQSFAQLCLDEAAPGFATITKGWIDNYMACQADIEQERGYVVVNLADDPILMDAGRIAFSEHAEEVGERHVLLAFLRSTTGLRGKIHSELDVAAFTRLLETAKSRVPTFRNTGQTNVDFF